MNGSALLPFGRGMPFSFSMSSRAESAPNHRLMRSGHASGGCSHRASPLAERAAKRPMRRATPEGSARSGKSMAERPSPWVPQPASGGSGKKRSCAIAWEANLVHPGTSWKESEGHSGNPRGPRFRPWVRKERSPAPDQARTSRSPFPPGKDRAPTGASSGKPLIPGRSRMGRSLQKAVMLLRACPPEESPYLSFSYVALNGGRLDRRANE